MPLPSLMPPMTGGITFVFKRSTLRMSPSKICHRVLKRTDDSYRFKTRHYNGIHFCIFQHRALSG
jgi:hypothetical protein